MFYHKPVKNVFWDERDELIEDVRNLSQLVTFCYRLKKYI